MKHTSKRTPWGRLVALGVFILFLGWFGFNGGSYTGVPTTAAAGAEFTMAVPRETPAETQGIVISAARLDFLPTSNAAAEGGALPGASLPPRNDANDSSGPPGAVRLWDPAAKLWTTQRRTLNRLVKR